MRPLASLASLKCDPRSFFNDAPPGVPTNVKQAPSRVAICDVAIARRARLIHGDDVTTTLRNSSDKSGRQRIVGRGFLGLSLSLQTRLVKQC